jgi:4-hydroxy-4-methyl-2-oxoglutarate aldolase
MQIPIKPELLEALKGFDSPTISNAIEHFKIRDRSAGFASMEMRCQFPEQAPMVGYAVTCTADSTTPGETRPVRIDLLLDLIHEASKPAVLAIKYAGPDRLRSCFIGDVLCTTLQKLGVVGVVTDGGYRDRKGILQRAPGIQIFSPGMVVSHGCPVFLDFNIEVSLCGLSVKPGDLLHGDENGLLTVPAHLVDSILDRAKEVHAIEADLINFVRGEKYNYAELRRRISPPGK